MSQCSLGGYLDRPWDHGDPPRGKPWIQVLRMESFDSALIIGRVESLGMAIVHYTNAGQPSCFAQDCLVLAQKALHPRNKCHISVIFAQ